MEKELINVAEILKDCSKGLELYSPIFGKVYLDEIRPHLAIVVATDIKQGDIKAEFLYDGRYGMNGECMLFPSKGKTWEDFVPPCKFQDGDIVAHDNEFGKVELFIYKEYMTDNIAVCYLFLNDKTELHAVEAAYVINRLATEEEKAKLFQAIKDNGYRWNSETKSLELITPTFKVRDKIKNKTSKSQYVEVTEIKDTHYILNDGTALLFTSQDEYELVCPKFNISSLKPFDRVLVRNSDNNMWCASMFSHTWEGTYFCVGILHLQCIPYEGNEHLLGTTNSCDEFYKNWK